MKRAPHPKPKPSRRPAPPGPAPAAPVAQAPEPPKRRGIPSLPPIPALYYTMGQCSADTGIPMEMLSRARAMGCQAFRSGKVEMRPLLRFLTTLVGPLNGSAAGAASEQGTLELEPTTKITARAELDVWKARRERMRCLEEEGRLIDRDEVKACVGAGMAEFFAMASRMMGSELPPKLAGLEELEIRSRQLQALEELKEAFRQRMEQLHAEGKANEKGNEDDRNQNGSGQT